VPALYLSVQAVLSLYASGRTTGAVLDIGDGVTHAVPVYEGFAITQAIRRVDVAGRYARRAIAVLWQGLRFDKGFITSLLHVHASRRDVTRYLQTLLRKAGYPLTTSAELEIVREIKERICKVAPNLVKTTRETAGRTEEFILPDGVRVNVRARLRAAGLRVHCASLTPGTPEVRPFGHAAAWAGALPGARGAL